MLQKKDSSALVNAYLNFIFFYDCLIIRNVREFGSSMLVCCWGAAWSLPFPYLWWAQNLMKRKISFSKLLDLTTIVFIVDINTILISLTPFSCHLAYHSSKLKSSFDIQIRDFAFHLFRMLMKHCVMQIMSRMKGI